MTALTAGPRNTQPGLDIDKFSIYSCQVQARRHRFRERNWDTMKWIPPPTFKFPSFLPATPCSIAPRNEHNYIFAIVNKKTYFTRVENMKYDRFLELDFHKTELFLCVPRFQGFLSHVNEPATRTDVDEYVAFSWVTIFIILRNSIVTPAPPTIIIVIIRSTEKFDLNSLASRLVFVGSLPVSPSLCHPREKDLVDYNYVLGDTRPDSQLTGPAESA